MRLILMIPALGVFVYLLSFAKYNWIKKNKAAAIGGVIMAIATIAAPFLL
ncbi:MAG: hypothetical protein GX352_07845 [Clostridiales bacterium]|nr:hypothetical protein [Clostridiales bacterium]